MKKHQAQLDWWDWPSIALLFILLQTVASRLVATNWTKDLGFTQLVTSMSFVVGLALGRSHFKRGTTRWLSLLYMLEILPLILVRVISKEVANDERFISIGGRLWHSLVEFFARKPVEDPLFFVAIMCVAFWIICASAGFNLVRHQNFLAITLPAMVGLLVIQNYDNYVTVRLLFLAFFIFVALCLLGRINFLQSQKTWRERRIFLSPENSIDMTSTMTIAACLLIITTWTIPLSLTRVDSLRNSWQELTKPWTDFIDRMHNAVTSLETTGPGTPSEFYGTELELGNGFPLSDTVMFQVDVPELASNESPPRYYWRGRTYDYFEKGQWYITNTTRSNFSPESPQLHVADTANRARSRFVFTIGEPRVSLLYGPSEPVWFSRPGSYLTSPADTGQDVISWNATPTLLPGETYQVDAILSNPTIEDLRGSSTQYPQWVADKYLQLPKNFSPRIQSLAHEIADQAQTPYDKAVAITDYLRNHIEYAGVITTPPTNVDSLEWILFSYKKGYCVYYASADVLMLRSLGIPARMAVGFAQGTGTARTGENGAIQDTNISIYTVRKKNAHAWPEVYFSGIGWVEFEPTSNQAPLDRPLALRPDDSSLIPNPIRNIPQGEEAQQPEIPPSDSNTTDQNQRIPLTLYLIPSFVLLAALTVFFGRRYNVPARVPGFVRTTMEHNGIDVPVWIIRWERWAVLSPIERDFESINFGLRRMKQPAPMYATPIERADSLTKLLPHLAPRIKVLLDEHQTSLYTSRIADEKEARSAANQIRVQVILSILRHWFTGQYDPQGTT
jgi:transglutaminase-like putative cysteine protease